MDDLVATLSRYYPNPTYTIGGAKNLFDAVIAVERKRADDASFGVGHTGFQVGRNKNLIYCGNCLMLKPELGGARYVILAEVDHIVDKYEQPGNGLPLGKVGVKLTKLYPHCRECNVEPVYRFNRCFDQETGGCGFNIWRHLPQDEIFKSLFHDMVNVFRNA